MGRAVWQRQRSRYEPKLGDENLQRYMVFYFDEFKARRAKGDTATELLDPDSPKYLGKSIGNYVRTPQQIMRDMVPKKSQGSGVPLPKEQLRQPGESAADYLKRIKGGG